MKMKYLIPFIVILLFALPLVAQDNEPQLLILDFGWVEEDENWCVYAPIHELEDFVVQIWDENMTSRIPNATVIFSTHTGEYNITKSDEHGQAYFKAPSTDEKMERCMLYVTADGFENTSRFTYIHNQGIWKLKCSATSSTIDVNGKTKPFNVSKYWKIEWDYVARRDDCCLRIMAIRPEGNLFFYHIIFDNRRSSGTLYGRGAMNDIKLDVFAGRINSWNVKVFDHD